MPFFLWSKTSASNATADPNINWAEGQPPASINDSARATMAVLRGWGNDIAGSLVTTGTSTAYVLATNQVFDSFAHLGGQALCFVLNVTCGSPVTLNVDGLGVRPLRPSPGVEVSTGMLVAGTPYVATYNATDGVFYLQNFYINPFNLPIGGMMPYLGTSAPNSNFALPFGQAISRTTFATLFALISTTFGAGDGTTTFNIPDLRGRTILGLDNMGGSAAGRVGTVATDSGTIVGTTFGSVGGSATHVQTQAEMPSHTHTFTGNALPPHSHTTTASNSNVFFAGCCNAASPVFAAGTATSSDSAGTPTGSNSSIGSSAAMSILPPAMMLPMILRIL